MALKQHSTGRKAALLHTYDAIVRLQNVSIAGDCQGLLSIGYDHGGLPIHALNKRAIA